MNITETPTSLIANSSNNSSNASQDNSTQSSSSDVDPTQRLWDLRWFGILSGPLLFLTIIFPLIIGPLIRWLLQTYLRVRGLWRNFIFIPGLVFLVCYYKYLNNHRLVNTVLISLWDGSVLLIGIFRLCKALHSKEKRAKWGIFVLFAIVCLMIDEFVTEPVLLGMFSWSIFYVMFLFSYGHFERCRRLLQRIYFRVTAFFVR